VASFYLARLQNSCFSHSFAITMLKFYYNEYISRITRRGTGF
jgi:hypothetical protein